MIIQDSLGTTSTLQPIYSQWMQYNTRFRYVLNIEYNNSHII